MASTSGEVLAMKVRSRRIKIRPNNPLKEEGPKRFPFLTVPRERTRMLARSRIIHINDSSSSSCSDESIFAGTQLVEEEADPFVDFDRTIAFGTNKTSTPLPNRTESFMSTGVALPKTKPSPSPILSATGKKALFSTPSPASKRIKKSLFSSLNQDDAKLKQSLPSSTPVFKKIGKPLLSSTKIDDTENNDRLTNAAKLYKDRIKLALSESQCERVTSQLLHKNAICDTVLEEEK